MVHIPIVISTGNRLLHRQLEPRRLQNLVRLLQRRNSRRLRIQLPSPLVLGIGETPLRRLPFVARVLQLILSTTSHFAHHPNGLGACLNKAVFDAQLFVQLNNLRFQLGRGFGRLAFLCLAFQCGATLLQIATPLTIETMGGRLRMADAAADGAQLDRRLEPIVAAAAGRISVRTRMLLVPLLVLMLLPTMLSLQQRMLGARMIQAQVADGAAEIRHGRAAIQRHLARVEFRLQLRDHLLDVAFAVLTFGHAGAILLHLATEQLDLLAARCFGTLVLLVVLLLDEFVRRQRFGTLEGALSGCNVSADLIVDDGLVGGDDCGGGLHRVGGCVLGGREGG